MTETSANMRHLGSENVSPRRCIPDRNANNPILRWSTETASRRWLMGGHSARVDQQVPPCRFGRCGAAVAVSVRLTRHAAPLAGGS